MKILRPLDQLLAAIRPKTTDPKQSLGVSGTPSYAGWLATSEQNPKLTGRQRYQTYSDMLANVAIVGAGVRYYLNLVSKAGWKVEPAEDGGDEAQKAAELVEDCLENLDTPWYRIVRRAAMFKFYGFSIAEWTAEQAEDGRVLFSDVEARPQITIERWDIDEGGNVAGVIQRAPRDQRVIYLPRQKLVYCVDDSLNDSPEGLGLFRHVAEACRKLERYQDLEGMGFESDLRGMPVVKAPLTVLNNAVKNAQLSTDGLNAILQPFKTFLTNHVKNPQQGIMLDSAPYTGQDATATPSSVPQWDFSIAKNESEAQAEVAAAIVRLNEEIARVLGVEHVLLGATSRGSNALSRDKSDNFALMVDSTLAELRQTFEKDLIMPLMALNGIDAKLAPSFVTEAIAYRDIEQVTTALFQLAQAGAVLSPTDPAVNEVREILGLSKQEEVSVDGTPLPQPPRAGVSRKAPDPLQKPPDQLGQQPQLDPKTGKPVATSAQPGTAARQLAAESDGKTAPDAHPAYSGPIRANPGTGEAPSPHSSLLADPKATA